MYFSVFSIRNTWGVIFLQFSCNSLIFLVFVEELWVIVIIDSASYYAMLHQQPSAPKPLAIRKWVDGVYQAHTNTLCSLLIVCRLLINYVLHHDKQLYDWIGLRLLCLILSHSNVFACILYLLECLCTWFSYSFAGRWNLFDDSY